MNVDILAKDPSWHLYFFVSIPFLAIVIAIWVLCKYLPVRPKVDHNTVS